MAANPASGGMPSRLSRKIDQGDRHPGRAADHAAIAGQVFRAGLVAQKRHHRKGPQVHEQIRNQVEEHGPGAFTGQGSQSHHHVAGVGDRRIGEQAFEVRLKVSRQVAEGGGQGREEGQGRHKKLSHLEAGLHACQAGQRQDEPCQQCQGRAFRRHRQKSGHFGRRTFKYIGTPEVERHRRQLEGDADENEQGAEHEDRDRACHC